MGSGYPGIVAATLGGRVVVVDEQQAALDFVAASAAANGVVCEARQGDFTTLDPTSRFDVVLAAEVVYDPGRFADVAAVFVRHLEPGGVGLLADGYRTDTRGLYRELARCGVASHAIDVRVEEEGRMVPVRVSAIAAPSRAVRPPDSPRPPA